MSEKSFLSATEERLALQWELASIDDDPELLQEFIKEHYTDMLLNPHVFYLAATHLTAHQFLDARHDANVLNLPSQEQTAKAFSTYTKLLDMLTQERLSPAYELDAKAGGHLVGAREELAFHATLAYATLQGAELVARPARSAKDFYGKDKAHDIQLLIPPRNKPVLDIQIKRQGSSPESLDDVGIIVKDYHPRILVIGLIDVLDGEKGVMEYHNLLRTIGGRDDPIFNGHFQLPSDEHKMVMQTADNILTIAGQWMDGYVNRAA